MSNHIHVVLAGSEKDIRGFFAYFKERLRRYLSGEKRFCRMERFEAELFEIPDLRALRNEIIYVNRNGYVVSPDCTPFSYWWSAGVFFFNPMGKMLPVCPFSSLTKRDQRSLCRSRDLTLPDAYLVWRGFRPGREAPAGMLLYPPSFCVIDEAEGFFRNAQQYFRRLSRDHEAHSEVANRLSEKIFLTDDELYGAIYAISTKDYGISTPNLLPAKDKENLARRMHFDYNASNKQIQRMLKLSPSKVAELFPEAESVHK